MTEISVDARGFEATRAVTRGRAIATVRLFSTGVALAMAVALRWQVFRTQALDGVTEGLMFGFALLAIWSSGSLRPSVPPAGAIVAGLSTGIALVAVSVLTSWPTPRLALAHAAPFLPWAVATTLVATGEELVLRGALWRWATDAGGDATALLLTSIAFALIHVPIYGWAVVPLDLGVGLCFGGLRLWFGGPAAPAAAHVLADLATWWL